MVLEGSPTLGVIGGMGPLATATFLRLLTVETSVESDQEHLHVLVDSDPSIPDRTGFLLGSGPDPRPALVRSAQRLEAAGATYLAMPCNTANIFAADISSAVSAPLLPWFEITTASVATCGQRVGILATDGMLATHAYQDALERRGLTSLVPDARDQRSVMAAIYGKRGVKVTGTISKDGRSRLLEVARRLADQGADCLLLACTELPIAIAADDSAWPRPAVDPSVQVVREALRHAGLPLRYRAGPGG